MIPSPKSQRIALLAIAVLSISYFCPLSALAENAKSRYFKAERCYRQLQNNPGQQKYRDRWFRCINSFLAVHKQEPRGVWASVSLYQAGKLYAEMYQHSYFEGDKEEALDIFDRVIRNYPKSHYRQEALESKKALLQGRPEPVVPPAADTKAQSFYDKAQEDFQRLQQNSKLSKYRDQWFRCIEGYQKAYQADPKGPLAAASLFGQAESYHELSRYSFSQSDRDQAMAAYQQLITDFGESAYADKARSALDQAGYARAVDDKVKAEEPAEASDPATGDRIARLIAERPSGYL